MLPLRSARRKDVVMRTLALYVRSKFARFRIHRRRRSDRLHALYYALNPGAYRRIRRQQVLKMREEIEHIAMRVALRQQMLRLD